MKKKLIRADVIAFLDGSQPLMGRWFGDVVKGETMFWWRKFLPRQERRKKQGAGK